MLSTGVAIPSALMYGSLVDQDINCRTIGRCVYGSVIDNELLDMVPRVGDSLGSFDERMARPLKPLSESEGRRFLYARYNVDLGAANLEALGFKQVEPSSVQKMDNATAANIETLLAIGAASARQVKKEHFGSFL